MKKIIDWKLPLRTVSESNSREHWYAKALRAKIQKKSIWYAFNEDRPNIPLPCIVKLSRKGPRLLDSDNLQSSFKAIRDQVADQIIPGLPPGRADGDPRIEWQYDQSKDKVYSVQIEVFADIPFQHL